MRSFIGSLIVLALVGLASSIARADIGTESRTRYSGCICKYGYQNPICRPVTACVTEGGWCAQRCVPPRRPPAGQS